MPVGLSAKGSARLAPWGAGRTGKKEDRKEAQCPQGALRELDFRPKNNFELDWN